MGGITSVLAALPAVASGVQALTSHRSERKENDLALRQLQEQQKLQEQKAASSAALDRERLALEAKNAEGERQAALKRAVARQRANFGSQGVGSGVGSSQAVLLGLFDESDDEQARREAMDSLKLRIINDDLAQRRASNVLERTQLAERNKIGNLTNDVRFGTKAIGIAQTLF